MEDAGRRLDGETEENDTTSALTVGKNQKNQKNPWSQNTRSLYAYKEQAGTIGIRPGRLGQEGAIRKIKQRHNTKKTNKQGNIKDNKVEGVGQHTACPTSSGT